MTEKTTFLESFAKLLRGYVRLELSHYGFSIQRRVTNDVDEILRS